MAGAGGAGDWYGEGVAGVDVVESAGEGVSTWEDDGVADVEDV